MKIKTAIFFNLIGIIFLFIISLIITFNQSFIGLLINIPNLIIASISAYIFYMLISEKVIKKENIKKIRRTLLLCVIITSFIMVFSFIGKTILDTTGIYILPTGIDTEYVTLPLFFIILPILLAILPIFILKKFESNKKMRIVSIILLVILLVVSLIILHLLPNIIISMFSYNTVINQYGEYSQRAIYLPFTAIYLYIGLGIYSIMFLDQMKKNIK